MSKIQLRRAETADWAAFDPVLAEGELGLDLTLLRLKVGDGVTAWSALNYLGAAPLTYTRLAPSTEVSDNTLTALANTAATITGTFSDSGVILFDIDGYYEFTGTTAVYGKMAGPGIIPDSAMERIAYGVNGDKVFFHHTFEVTGGTPGVTSTWIFQHSSDVSNLAFLKYSNLTTSPPLVLRATPI